MEALQALGGRYGTAASGMGLGLSGSGIRVQVFELWELEGECK